MHSLFRSGAHLALLAMVLGLAGPSVAAKLPDVVVTGDPVAPSPGQPGTGLCVASSVSTDPAADFPQSTSGYIEGMNDFMERTSASRTTYVLRTLFDLSNNNTTGLQTSRGDFVDAVAGCSSYGCGFFLNDATTSFGSRFRGYLNVTQDMVNKVLHFGLFTDDAVSFALFDRNGVSYQVINRPPQLGAPAWRTTNRVTFTKTGLYPVEVLYAQVAEHAALEVSLLEGPFTDFERTANQTPIVRLNEADFLLVPPEKFFHSETGRPSFEDLDTCQQCNRANANSPGNSDCGQGRYCNGAALCAPCDLARVCGPSCMPCGQSTPFCINVSGAFTCVECSEDGQCPNGRCAPDTLTCTGCNDDGDCSQSTGHCDLTTHTCTGCNDDADCPSGRICDVPHFTCVECTSDTDCPSDKVCDPELKQCRECQGPGCAPGADGGTGGADGGGNGSDGGSNGGDGGNGGTDGGSDGDGGSGGGDGGQDDGGTGGRDGGSNGNSDGGDGNGDGDSGDDGGGCGCGTSASARTTGGAFLMMLMMALLLRHSRRGVP